MAIENLKRRRREFRRQGLCPHCGSEPALDRVYCEKHLIYGRRRMRELRKQWKKEGRCTCCGQQECRYASTKNAREREKRRRRLAEGVCTVCGSEREEQKYRLCELCREYLREWQARN